MAHIEQSDLVEPLLGSAQADQRRGTVTSSILNLTATAMGSGLLTLPYAYAICGPRACTCLLIILAITSDITMVNLVRVGREVKASNFSEVLQNVLGNKGKRIFQVVTACVLFLAMTSMQRVIADLLPIFIEEVLGLASGTVRPVLLCSVVNAALLVVCLSKTVHGLRFTSGAALICLMPFIVVIIARALTNEEHSADTAAPLHGYEGLLVASPLLASSVMCHFNIVEIDSEMRPRCKKEIYNVVHIVSLIILPAIYAAVGLSGFILFGSSVAENVLVEFQDDGLMQVARGVLSFTNVLRVPLMALPLRAMLRESMQTDISSSAKVGAETQRTETPPRALEVIPLLAGSVVAAFGLERLTKVMGLLGGTCGVLGCFIVPSYLELVLPRGSDQPIARSSKLSTSCPRPIADFGAVVGLIVGFLVFLATIVSWRSQ